MSISSVTGDGHVVVSGDRDSDYSLFPFQLSFDPYVPNRGDSLMKLGQDRHAYQHLLDSRRAVLLGRQAIQWWEAESGSGAGEGKIRLSWFNDFGERISSGLVCPMPDGGALIFVHARGYWPEDAATLLHEIAHFFTGDLQRKGNRHTSEWRDACSRLCVWAGVPDDSDIDWDDDVKRDDQLAARFPARSNERH